MNFYFSILIQRGDPEEMNFVIPAPNLHAAMAIAQAFVMGCLYCGATALITSATSKPLRGHKYGSLL